MISVVIPVYNIEKQIGKCLESIINQNYRDFEIILVNDGSKDDSKNVVLEYLKDKDLFPHKNTNNYFKEQINESKTISRQSTC